jgi:hypothetical protein
MESNYSKRQLNKVFRFFGPGKRFDCFNGAVVNRNNDLRRGGKGGFTEWSGKGFVFRREISFVIGMGMVEGLELGARSTGFIEHSFQFPEIHGVRDGRGARICQRIERMKLVLNVFHAPRVVRRPVGQHQAATLVGKRLLGVSRNLGPSLFRH